MKLNGKPVLACTVPAEADMVLEPSAHHRPLRDVFVVPEPR